MSDKIMIPAYAEEPSAEGITGKVYFFENSGRISDLERCSEINTCMLNHEKCRCLTTWWNFASVQPKTEPMDWIREISHPEALEYPWDGTYETWVEELKAEGHHEVI